MVRWFAALIALTLIIAVVAGGSSGNRISGGHSRELRTDIVKVNALNRPEMNERPAVLFYHDLHTDAMEENKDGCRACHRSVSGKDAFRFIDLETGTKDQRMDAYHSRCVGCHKENLSAGHDSGPVICSGCHKDKPSVTSSSVSGRFDKSLHQRHMNALDQSCQSCHHVYDQKNSKLVYQKGKEESCAYCHSDGTPVKAPLKQASERDLKHASHMQCVGCHESRKALGKKSGPNRCEGCHDPTAKNVMTKTADIKRLDMGQKDFTMLKDQKVYSPLSRKNRMDFVPFDHKNHEMKNDSCRVCHHKSLDACVTCHTAEGSPKGANISLEKVMHMPKSERSCNGCHEMKRRTENCAGCHTFDVNWIKDERKSCARCHVVPGIEKDENAQASSLIYSRIRKNLASDPSKIPDRIVINKLEKEYGPVVFPHRKIVNALYSKINDNRMAQYFHEKTSLCMGCHHNSPATANPTACGNCHSAAVKDKDSDRKPGLLGAYHIQCMECHAQMNIRQPESCISCHKKK